MDKLSKKEVKDLLLALNPTDLFKYPVGNKELTEKIKQAETLGLIVYDNKFNTWKGK